MTKFLVHVRSEIDVVVSADNKFEAIKEARDKVYSDNRELLREMDMDAEEFEE